MGEALDAGDQLERQRPRRQHVERAVLIVVVEDAVGGEQACKQERHPQHAWRDAREEIEVGAEAERRDGDHDEVEAERGADGAALAPGKHDIAAEQRPSLLHWTVSRFSASSCANFTFSEVWLATTAMPPCARC